MNTATLPAPLWSVGRGQRVQLVSHGWRRRVVDATVVHGTLVGDDPAASHFELVITLPEAPDRPITVAPGTVRAMSVTSEGVFRNGERALSMWLTVRATLDLPDVRRLTGHGEISLFAELNLNPAP